MLAEEEEQVDMEIGQTFCRTIRESVVIGSSQNDKEKISNRVSAPVHRQRAVGGIVYQTRWGVEVDCQTSITTINV